MLKRFQLGYCGTEIDGVSSPWDGYSSSNRNTISGIFGVPIEPGSSSSDQELGSTILMRPRLEQPVLPATEPERDDLLYQEPEQINLRTADQG